MLKRSISTWLRYTPLQKSGSLSHQFTIVIPTEKFFLLRRGISPIPCKAVAAMRNLCSWCSKYWKNLSQRGFDTPRNKKAGHSATILLLSFRQRSSFYFDKESFIFRARRQPRYGILSFRASDSEMRNPYKWCNFLFNFWIKLVLSFIFSIDEKTNQKNLGLRNSS